MSDINDPSMNDQSTGHIDLRDVEFAARIEVARKVGALIKKKSEGDSEREQALTFARLLVEDASISVREALSKELRQCRFLPDDIVRALSEDIDQISMPFLISYDAIPDDLLESLVLSGSDGVREAIAGRDNLSELVSFAICDNADVDAVAVLMDNKTADVSHRSGERTLDRFPTEMTLLEKLATREDFSAALVERIIFKISESYSKYLVERFDLATDYSSYLMGLSRRQVFNQTLDGASIAEIERYLQQLYERNELTSDSLLSFLQNKHLRLFVAALALLVGRPFDVLNQGLVNGDAKLLARILNRAGFSKSVVGVLVIAYQRLFDHA